MFYKHSGRLGLSVPAILLIGIPVVILLSAIYAYIVVYCPVVGYVNVLFLGGYVFAAGIALAMIAKMSKCRSPSVLLALGTLGGLVGLYFSWVFFIKALFGEDVSAIAVALSPLGILEVAKEINANGWWGPSGIAQWALVAIEAAVIVGGIALFTSSSISREAFCEDCSTWCNPFETMHLKLTPELAAKDPSELDHLQLLGLEEVDKSEYPRLDAEVLQCTGCEKTQAIRFKKVAQVMDDGELKEQAEDIPGILIQKA
ncbi:hypothetical protein CA13_37350 [Planctomycetes bacterium CA13]|uniref:Transmembrane protein n=2 Tax=Novipirellula herctigrandis TaxID=2527986 RepID=A0A5C5Z6W3_9BACT|nr:hypothetical protein CA13_37350 [Planctomycetes bacterium CA13]